MSWSHHRAQARKMLRNGVTEDELSTLIFERAMAKEIVINMQSRFDTFRRRIIQLEATVKGLKSALKRRHFNVKNRTTQVNRS